MTTAERKHAWYLANRDAILADKKARRAGWTEERKERERARRRERYKQNPEPTLARCRARLAADPSLREWHRQYAKRWWASLTPEQRKRQYALARERQRMRRNCEPDLSTR